MAADMPMLKKYMKKKGMQEDPGEMHAPEAHSPEYEPEPAPQWEPGMVSGHGDVSTDAFETVDTDNDPLEDHAGPDSKVGMTALERYQKLKKK